MPAICQNVRNWYGNPAVSSWYTTGARGIWRGWFSFDLGASGSDNRLDRGQARRDQMCPRTWKGTVATPRCPEPNQPYVVPPLWNLAGQGVTAIKPQPLTDPEVFLTIEDGRDLQWAGALQPSGRRYTCDEFPPASWIEGGVGIAPWGHAGTTYCAPASARCGNNFNARGSEQVWQGQIHGYLGTELELGVAGQNPTQNTPIGFRFEYNTHNPANFHPWAARVRTLGATTERYVIPGTHWRRSEKEESFTAIEFHPIGNGSLAIALPNGEVFRTHEPGEFHRGLHRLRELARRDSEVAGTKVATPEEILPVNKTKDIEWFVPHFWGDFQTYSANDAL